MYLYCQYKIEINNKSAGKGIKIKEKNYRKPHKGTGSPDGLVYCGHVLIDQGLNKGHGWFLNFFIGSSDFLLK